MKEKEINTQKANVLLLALFVVMFVTSIIAIVYISNKNILFSNREIDKNYKSYYPPLRNINYKISLIRKLKQEDKNYIIFNVENPEKITYSYQYFERMESQMRIENIQSNTEPQIHDPKPTIAFRPNEGIIVVEILNKREEFPVPFPTKEILKQQIRTEINQKKSSLPEELFQEIKRIFESNNVLIEKIGINIRNEPNQELENPNGSVWGNEKDENFRIQSFNNIIEYDILIKELIDNRNQTLPLNRKAKIVVEYEMYGSFRIGGGFTYRNEDIVQQSPPPYPTYSFDCVINIGSGGSIFGVSKNLRTRITKIDVKEET